MARPSKSIKTVSGHRTKQEKIIRMEAENALRGSGDIRPPKYLTRRQKIVFNNLVKELMPAQILGSVDVYVLTQAAIAIDRLRTIETEINKDNEKMFNRDVLAARERYTKDFFRCCNELSLSPQARAKIGNIALQQLKQQEDPLLKILGGGQSAT